MIERRTILRGLVAAPFGGIAAASAVAPDAAPDPIFAAIEKHRAAWAAFEAADRKGHRILDIPDDIVADSANASEIEEQARFDMHETVPTTIAGLVAYVSYWMAHMGPWENEPGYGQLEYIGWEAIPTIAEAMATLFPAAAKGGAA